VARFPTNVEELGVDFYAFSGHKLYGPMGIGVLWGRYELLEKMPPYQGGGDMIESVTFARTTYAQLPNKFEAGTPHVAGAVGLQAAIEYLQGIGLDRVARHEEELLEYATAKLQEVPGLRIVGQARRKAGVISFLLEEPCVSPLDVGAHLDLDGIAVRTGHHCCQPLMDRLGITGTVRASLGVYNNHADVDACVASLRRLHGERAAQTPRCIAHAEPVATSRPEPKYPNAAAPSPAEAAEELVEAFDFLEDWQQRYQYLIDLGRKLLPVPEFERTEANRVKGCQSTVYLSARKRPGTADVMDFLAESDADLVSGLIAILQRVFSGQKAADILAFNVEKFFERLGIDQHLALTRRNGLAAMVQRIRALASAMVEASTTCTKADCAQCADGAAPPARI
jgi:cysteine desulfurase/selenocysteine lyase